MRLIACPHCHTQYDVTDVLDPSVRCRCGVEIENRELEPAEARVYRCGSCSAQVESNETSCKYCGSQIACDESQLSLICPECFGRNADDARFCAACGVTFSPESICVDGVELPCPCCGCLMAVRGLIGITLNECGQCNGLWVPGNKFDALVSSAIDARNKQRDAVGLGGEPRVKGANPFSWKVEYRKCPECEAFMLRQNFRKTSGVIIDSCREHGSWLDADELEQIAGFIMSGGRPAADEFLASQKENDKKSRVEAARAARRQIETVRESSTSATGGAVFEFLFDLLN
ncbi:MAG: Zn-finger nucleic acid-binding protein [Myxococcota bacterium]